MIKIAISGKPRSGKSTTAKGLKKKALANGYVARTVSHGTWIKGLAEITVGLSKEDRDGLQLFAYDFIMKGCRKFFGHENFWTKLVLKDASIMEDHGVNFIICDDLRFRSQADLLKENGFKLVRLDTTPELTASRDQEGKSAGAPEHPCETELDNYPCWDLVTTPDLSVIELVGTIWVKLVEAE